MNRIPKSPLEVAPSNLTRRNFLYNSAGAFFASTLLSSCNLMEDIFPGLAKERDQTLAFYGDSLTIGAGGTAPYGNIVGTALSNRPVISNGIVGQPAASIAVRQGGVPLIITIESNKLNGIKPVRITKLSNPFLSTASNDDEYSRTGTINGVRCTIRRKVNGDLAESYTITPTTVSVIEVAPNTEFILDDVDRLRSATQILWYGRNNIGKPNAEDEILTALKNSIAYIEAPARYIVPGILLAATENKGTERFKQILAINEKLAAIHGKSYVAMTPPTDAEMAAIDYIPTTNDLKDLENLNFPRGMRFDIQSDDIHLNDKGYKIVANRVIAKIKELKY